MLFEQEDKSRLIAANMPSDRILIGFLISRTVTNHAC